MRIWYKRKELLANAIRVDNGEISIIFDHLADGKCTKSRTDLL
jgi:hypothetical protein